jgi:hypothetical protein
MKRSTSAHSATDNLTSGISSAVELNAMRSLAERPHQKELSKPPDPGIGRTLARYAIPAEPYRQRIQEQHERQRRSWPKLQLPLGPFREVGVAADIAQHLLGVAQGICDGPQKTRSLGRQSPSMNPDMHGEAPPAAL